MSTAFFKMPRQSMSKPVPSERRMSQKKRTTRPCAGRHGRSDMVEVSGTKKSSLSASFFKAHDARSINGNAALERRSQKARLNGDDLLSAENIAERHFDELNVVICDKLCDLGLRILHAEPFLSFLKARFKHTNTREIRCCRLSRCTCSSFLPHFEIFCQNTAYADRF